VLLLSGILAAAAATVCSPHAGELMVWLVWPLGGLAWVFVIAGLLASDRHGSARPADAQGRIATGVALAIGLAGFGLSSVSMLDWVGEQMSRYAIERAAGSPLPLDLWGWLGWWFAARNHQPLGHVNYTGGAALLFLPWLMWLAWHVTAPVRNGRTLLPWASRGFRRVTAGGCLVAVGLSLAMLLSSGSRGAWLALLVVTILAAVLIGRFRTEFRRPLLWSGLVLLLVGVVLACAHPALRSSLRPRTVAEIPNASNAERRTMMAVGWRMGLDRPLVGWGIGAVPLVYDRYRGMEVCGPVNMIQVHSTPLNLWAEGGMAACAVAAGLLWLAGRCLWRCAAPDRTGFFGSLVLPAGLSLLGYAVFGLTDYQLDLPLVALMVATDLGVLAAVDAGPLSRNSGYCVAVLALGIATALGLASRPWLAARQALEQGGVDRAVALLPEDSVLCVMRGLYRAEEARGASGSDRKFELLAQAEADLQAALAEGAHLGIAHSSLGWLYLAEGRPAEARAHFESTLAVAASYPGSWLGRGLAALALGRRDEAVDALAMECLADPGFLASGWWAQPSVAPMRDEVLAAVQDKLEAVARTRPTGRWPEPQARYYAAVVRWLRGDATAGDVARAALDNSQRVFWSGMDVGLLPQAWDAIPLGPALRSESGARERLRLHLEHIGGFMLGVQVDRFMGILEGNPTPEMALRRLWYASADVRPRVVVEYPLCVGFGARLRNPYAQRMQHCMPVLHNPVAECSTAGLLPPRGWLYEDRLREVGGGP